MTGVVVEVEAWRLVAALVVAAVSGALLVAVWRARRVQRLTRALEARNAEVRRLRHGI